MIEIHMNRHHHPDLWIGLLLRGIEPQHRRFALSDNPLRHSMPQNKKIDMKIKLIKQKKKTDI